MHISFNKFKSAISQEVTQQQLIPLDVSNSEKEEEKKILQMQFMIMSLMKKQF